MPLSDVHNPGNDWDNQLKINPEIKFPSEKSKFTTPFPPNNVDDHLHQPSLLLIFSRQHWTGG